MVKRAGLVALVVALVASVGFVGVRGQDGRAADLVVHEWGTFTSVAGPDGQAVPWHPLSGSSDLPCFVQLLNPGSVKVELPVNGAYQPVSLLTALRASVRMETPVLYFYSPRDTTVDVRVQFPHGLITEWYPQAVVPAPCYPINFAAAGSISWPAVHVRPAARPDFPTEPGSSHYYAARATDAAPVAASGQLEKFLFYRGLADFPPAIRARETGANSVLIENTGPNLVPHLILFESDGQHFGYRAATALATRRHDCATRAHERPRVAPPRPRGDARRPRPLPERGRGHARHVARLLVRARSARALPGAAGERGRDPAARDRAGAANHGAGVRGAHGARHRRDAGRHRARASIARDYLALAKYGRFLEPAMDQMWNRASESERRRIETAFAAVAKILRSAETSCQAPGTRQ